MAPAAQFSGNLPLDQGTLLGAWSSMLHTYTRWWTLCCATVEPHTTWNWPKTAGQRSGVETHLHQHKLPCSPRFWHKLLSCCPLAHKSSAKESHWSWEIGTKNRATFTMCCLFKKWAQDIVTSSEDTASIRGTFSNMKNQGRVLPIISLHPWNVSAEATPWARSHGSIQQKQSKGDQPRRIWISANGRKQN